MGNVIPMTDIETERKDYRYAVYEHKLVGPDEIVYSRSFIVIKNKYDVIIRFTRLHNFVGAYENKVFRPLTSDVKAKMHYICMMLNYVLIDHYDVYKVDHVFKVTKEILTCFFMDYALEKKADGGYRGSQSIEKCVYAVTLFFKKLTHKHGGYLTLKKEELYVESQIFTKRGRMIKKQVPAFQIRGIQEKQEIFRDIPTKVFQILINLAVRYAPDISFAIGLQAFAGLRPGEVCNVRQERSTKGAGIIMTFRDGKLIKAEIDLTREYAMRSDGVVCGRIKKERKQCVYPPFLEAFQTLYEYHKKFLTLHGFEDEFSPMFVNKRGMAMTYDDYYARFQRLIEVKLRPVLMNHIDPEYRIYGQMLCENRLGPHALRHWFSVQLALRGEDVAQLQFWRGDKNPESAFGYLQNKGDLIRELAKTNELMADFLLEKGKRNCEEL